MAGVTGEILMEYGGWYKQLKPMQTKHWTALASRLPSLSHKQRVESLATVSPRTLWSVAPGAVAFTSHFSNRSNHLIDSHP